jgi:cyclopropane fatty-acyl-phospholipid synthase-like methyltransferase
MNRLNWQEIYQNGEYAARHPSWHVEDSAWKARHVLDMLQRHGIRPSTVCEVGCGAGEILSELQRSMDQECRFWGYEVSPQAYELCRRRANDRLQFKLMDLAQEDGVCFDVLLLIDIIEHLEDYFALLRGVKTKGTYKVLHVPLEFSGPTVVRKHIVGDLRATYGHLHFFSKELVLAVLTDVGYRVLDWCYTTGSLDFPARSTNAAMMRPLRRLLFGWRRDLAARLLGGFSLMVLAT